MASTSVVPAALRPETRPFPFSLHTAGASSSEDHRVGMVTLHPEMPFSEAADIFLDNVAAIRTRQRVARFIRENTLRSYRQYLTSLSLFFGDTRLNRITPPMIRKFQEYRVAGIGCFMRPRRPKAPIKECPAGPKKVNQEICLLRRILAKAGCWQEIDDAYYAPLLEEHEDEIQRALTRQEQEHWLAVAASSPRWQLVYWYSLLAFGTTMSSNELRLLRLADINLEHQTITVSRVAAKCKGRQRIISLVTAQELWSAECLLERARRCGAANPLDYVFPMRHRGPNAAWDPTKPMTNSGFKKQWEEVREATGLKRFRIYDTRHTGGTRLAEAGVNISVIRARMGHLSQEMHEHYCRIAEPIQRQQLQDAYAWQKRQAGGTDHTLHPPFSEYGLDILRH